MKKYFEIKFTANTANCTHQLSYSPFCSTEKEAKEEFRKMEMSYNYCKPYIDRSNGTDAGYSGEYNGGIVSIVCSETGGNRI